MSRWSTSGSVPRAGSTLTRRLVDRDVRVVLTSTRAQDDLAELIAASPAVGFLWKAHLSGRALRDLVHAAQP